MDIESIGGNLHLNGTFALLRCKGVKFTATAGTVQVSPAPNCLGTKYAEGTLVSLQAMPKPTYGFLSWTDQTTNNPVDYIVNPFAYSVNSTRILSAKFTLIPAPIQVSLPNAAYTNDSTPELSWNMVSGGINYQIQISTTSSFAPVVQDLTSGGLFVVANPLPDGKYYWRVRALNPDTYPGVWSAVRYFTVDTIAPPAPGLKSPIDNYFSVGTPAFSWNASAGAKWYKLGVTTGGDCSLSDPDAFPLLMSTSYTPPTLNPGEWKWCVKAGDLAGNWSAWSASRTVDISPKVPLAPALVQPATAGFTNNTMPLLKWKPVAYGLYYEVQVSTVSTFLTTVVNETISDQEFSAYSADLVEGKYYWRVRAKNSDVAPGPWSAAWNFTVDKHEPPVPVLKTPADNAPSNGTPTFSWNASVGAKWYKLGYTLEDCASLDKDTLPTLTTTSYKPLTQVEGDLHWCVMAGDAAGNWSAWSDARTVHINPLVPVAPALVLPATAGFTNNTMPLLKWKSVAYGDKYQVQVSLVSTFLTTVENYSGPVQGFNTYTNPLVGGVKYYWRVRAYNSENKPGPWSLVWNFTVDTLPPAAPGMLTPGDGSIVNTTLPKLTISPVTGAKYYQFQVDPAGTFASPPVDVTLTTTTYTIPAAKSLDFGTNYWRVQAIDAAGNPSGWSVVRTFNVNIQKTPVNGSFTTSVKPVFTWTAVPGALHYRIQANKDTSDFITVEDLEINVTRSPSTSYTPSVALDYGTYYWQMQVETASGWSSWTAPSSFTINHP